MKIYEGKQEEKKSWAIRLMISPSKKEPCLCAVDSITGHVISTLIIFDDTGNTLTVKGSRGVIDSNGYDSDEHKTTFNLDGSLKIESM